MAAKQQQGANPNPQDELDPKFEWTENPTNYFLRLNLSGFKKEDFRVQVDGAGRLTVRGQRPAGAGADGKPVRFHKVFQLPPTANLDEISGRFDAGVLTLTVPKRSGPATIDEIKSKPKQEQHQPPPKPKDEEDDEASKTTKPPPKPKEDNGEARKTTATTKPPPPKLKEEEETIKKKALQQEKEEEEAKRRKQEEEQKAAAAAAVSKEEATKPKTEAEAGAFVRRESVRRRALEELAKAAMAAEEEAERERRTAAEEEAKREKRTAARGGWRERVVGELEELADMKWDGLAEAAWRNKEVIAAFSVGFFVAHKLFSRR